MGPRIPYGAVALGLAAGLVAPVARADDHRDGTVVVARPDADLTSLYAWVSGPQRETKLNLILGVQFDELGDDLQYVFHVGSGLDYQTITDEVLILCQHGLDRQTECWVGDELYLKGDASTPAGLATPDGRLRIFVGLRDDPFYFNQAGFEAVLSGLRTELPNVTKDAAQCPALPAGTANTLLAQLRQGEQAGPPTNFYQQGGAPDGLGRITALVVQVDKALVAKGGDVLAIWASTHQR